jgi:hypothetical protein
VTLKCSRLQASEIRARHAAGGVSMRSLAKEYGVNSGTVWCLLRGGTWQEDV